MATADQGAYAAVCRATDLELHLCILALICNRMNCVVSYFFALFCILHFVTLDSEYRFTLKEELIQNLL